MDTGAHLPLRPVEFQVLASLATSPHHGYAILQEIEAREGARAVPGLATLYRAIARLEKEGLIARVAEDLPSSEDDRRRIYRLTALGLEVVTAEALRLGPLVEMVKEARS
jgi:DNA-binding PadR family transcriptional regulator